MTLTNTPTDTARLRVAASSHSGDWLHAPPITSVVLCVSDEAIRIAVGFRLGAATCQLHTCLCGLMVDAKGLHGLSCRKSAPRQIRHAQVNDLVRRAVKKAQYPTVKEPAGLARTDGKRSNGATLIPWTRGKPLAWGITIPETYARSYIDDTAARATAAADRAAANKIAKYTEIKHDVSLHFDCNRDVRCMELTSYRIWQ